MCTTSSGNVAMGNRRCGLRNTEMLFTYLCMVWETDLHILWSSGVCLCVYVRMTTCVCGVNTDVVTFSFQYTAVIESNDITTPVGHFEVLSCAHVCQYVYLNLLFLKALIVVMVIHIIIFILTV